MMVKVESYYDLEYCKSHQRNEVKTFGVAECNDSSPSSDIGTQLLTNEQLLFSSSSFCYFASASSGASSQECIQNGERATTLPMMSSVGDTSPSDAILSARSSSFENTVRC